MTKVAIIGAGGHTRSSLNLLLTNYREADVCIYDDSFGEDQEERIHSIPVIGNTNMIDLNQSVFLSIGDNSIRKKYFLKFKDQIIKDNLFHKTSLQETNVTFGIANQVYANSYINSEVVIGDNNIINTGVILEHEVMVGNHNHISVGAKVCGRSKIGNECLIGADTVIADRLTICDNVLIGAGTVVVADINEPGTYVGNPAKRIK